MEFTVETWSPEYGTSGDEGSLDDSAASVDANVEMAAGEWAPIAAGAAANHSVVFVDGVRRIDARVWITEDGMARPGVCATVGAGAVRCDDRSAEVVSAVISRGLFAASSATAAPIATKYGTYDFVACQGDTPEDLYLGIHEKMTALETTLDLGAEADYVIFDGPLRGRTDPGGVGFIKTQHVQYLPDDQHRVVGLLAPGDRTPLFLVTGSGFSRWSWYVRLPGPVHQPLAGIVRCETPNSGTVHDAAARASAVTALLQRYASEPHKDTRAPQNLYPIAGLERDLRRRLGDPNLLERSLRLAAQRPA